MKSLTYLVETADSKKPPESTLGGRFLKDGIVMDVYDISTNSYTNGNVNRNIRLMHSMLEMIQPWIEVIGYKKSENDDNAKLEIFWRVNGCAKNINNIKHVFDD